MKKTLLLTLMSLSFVYAEMTKEMIVYKSPYCGCCANWITQMKDKGFNITTIEKENFDDLKISQGLTPKTASCHTALIGGYFIEGHVDYSAVKKLLTEQPKDIKGLSVPGMVVGSPGMEMGDKKMPYNVIAIKKDGTTEIYEKH